MPECLTDGNGTGTCTVCTQPVNGGFEVYGRQMRDGTPVIALHSTSDRDHNVCDLCNRPVHFRCSQHPNSGYCNDCHDKVQHAHVGTSNH